VRRVLLATALVAMFYGGMMTRAHAAPRKVDPPCSVSPSTVVAGQSYTVNVSGLPTMTPLNLFITNTYGTTGTPLGSSATGTFNWTDSTTVTGTTTYEFTGVVRNNTTVYSSCTVTVS
jgi:hypothetical protein